MKRQARVISTGTDNTVLVQLDALSQCYRCSRGQGCGVAVINERSAASPLQIQCYSENSALEKGQQVLIDIDESGSHWLWLAFGAYGLPLSGMLLACLLASLFTGQAVPIAPAAQASPLTELLVLLAAVSGLVGGFIAWRLLAPQALARFQRGTCLQSARIVAINPLSERAP